MRSTHFVALATVSFLLCTAWRHICSGPPEPRDARDHSPSSQPSGPTIYRNDAYAIRFRLPSDWAGYTVLHDQWRAFAYDVKSDRDVFAGTGPILILRHPKWQTNHRRQDIPILVFTTDQWKANVPEEIYAGGCMGELCRNERYVCGIHSRFAAADSVAGAQEAEEAAMQNLSGNKQE